MDEIDSLKHSTSGEPKYLLANASVFVSKSGLHYTRYLDSVDATPDAEVELSDNEVHYIEKLLQSNRKRFENQVDIVRRHIDPKGARALDVGCGGGLFLSLLKMHGATVTGIELSPTRAAYARRINGLKIEMHPIEDTFWKAEDPFDIVSLWDVIEHVNYPELTLKSCASSLRSGGFLFIDTPCRDSFYHRVGALTYRLTGGLFPTFLNAMYSSHQFGHKQIFSTAEMKSLMEKTGFQIVELRKFHELSFPYSVYLRKMLRSDPLVKMALPLVQTLLNIFPVRNKMLVVGCKLG